MIPGQRPTGGCARPRRQQDRLVRAGAAPPEADPGLVSTAAAVLRARADRGGPVSVPAAPGRCAGQALPAGRPAGFGKTTLLAQWAATMGAGRGLGVAGRGRQRPDPPVGLCHRGARTVEPGLGATALEALLTQSADLHRVVLPPLLNELGELDSPLVLVLDDYHLVANPTCHQSLAFFLDHLGHRPHGHVDPHRPAAAAGGCGPGTDSGGGAGVHRTGGVRAPRLDGAAAGRRGRGALPSGPRAGRPGCTWPASRSAAAPTRPGSSPPTAARHVADYLAAEVLARQPEASGRSCCAPRSWSACRAPCATRRARPRGPP